MSGDNEDLRALIRTIPDFPKPGIQFRDITTLLLDPEGLATTIERLASGFGERPDLIAGIDARGFVFAAALAYRMGTGLLLVRKDGKLPGETVAEEYDLEYGTNRLAMHVDACAPGSKVALVDDLLATGGTAIAAAKLIRRVGAIPTSAHFVIGLSDLGGAARLRAEGVAVNMLVQY